MGKGLFVGGVLLVLVILGFVMWNNRMSDTDRADVTEQEYAATSEPLGGSLLQGTPVTTSPATVQGEVKEFVLDASEFKYSVTEIRVKEGEAVRISLTNSGAMPHDWRVDEFDVATKTITSGQTDTVEFVADQAGTFEYYCSIGQHRANGMVGKLIVE